MDRFNVLLVEISSLIYETELITLKFLCRDQFGKKILEEITNPLDLWTKLHEKCLIKANDISYLKELIRNGLRNRNDILEKLERYEPSTCSQFAYDLDAGTFKDLSKEIEILCENVPVKSRKMFVRKLGLRDLEIDSIVHSHPHDAKEQFYKMLRLSMNKRSIGKQELIRSLRECNCNLTAELLANVK